MSDTQSVESILASVSNTATLTANTPVGSIVVEALPEGREKAVYLPGQARGTVSFDQQRMIARFVSENIDPALSWGDAIEGLRKRFLKGNQRDFGIVDGISQILRAGRAHDSLTPGQVGLLTTQIAALSGSAPHWEPNIAAKIKAANPRIVTAMTEAAILVSNQGELDLFMEKFSGLFGRPQARAGLGDVLGPATDEAPAAGKPVNGDEEPY